MGGSPSTEKNEIQYKPKALGGLILLGSTSKGPLAMNFQPEHIQSTKCHFKIPKYAQTILRNEQEAYLTGGVQELQSTTVQLTKP